MTARHSVTRACGASLLAIASLIAAPAWAQDGPGAAQPESAISSDEGGNEIIVTARRSSERLQDVPISVSVLSGEDIRRQQLDGFADIAKKTPGFSFEQFTGALAQTTIRGQTNLRTTSPVQNVVSYLNGIYLQRSYFIDQGIIDLQQFEVIKGPQAALYGRNAFAGAINMQTYTPDVETFSGTVSGTIGTDERYDAKGRINVPIIPGRLAVLVAGGYTTFDGTWKNNHPLAEAGGFTDGNVGGYKKYAYQFGVKAVVTEDLTAEAMWIHTNRKLEQVPAYSIGTGGTAYPFNSLNASPLAFPALAATNPFAAVLQNRLFVGLLPTTRPIAPGETRRPGIVVDPRTFGLRGPTDVAIGKLRFDPGGPFSAEYLFGYTYARIGVRGSSSQDALFGIAANGQANQTVFDSSGTNSSFKGYSHEGRVNYNFGDILSGLVGINYSYTRDVDSNASETAPVNSLQEPNPGSLFAVFPGATRPNTLTFPFQRNTFLRRAEDVWSIFAFANIKPADKLSITLEGRYTIEDQRGADLLANEVGSTTTIALNTPRVKRKASFFTPRASITYAITTQNNIYASVARGYKSGGINGVAATFTSNFVTQLTPGTALPSSQQFYAPETNWTYEIGTKNSFFDNILQLNVAAFYVDWKNLQSNAVRLQPNGQPPASFQFIVPSVIGNVGNVRVKGIEVDGNLRLAQSLRLNFGVSYSHSRYRNGTYSQRFGASGNCNGTVCAYSTVPGFSYPVLNISGNQLERTPAFTALAGLNFDTKFDNGWDFFARADVTYQTKQFADEANLAFVPERTLVNASTGITVGQFSAQLWLKNLFDKKYVSSSLFLIGTGGLGSASYVPILGEQRTAGLTASFNF